MPRISSKLMKENEGMRLHAETLPLSKPRANAALLAAPVQSGSITQCSTDVQLQHRFDTKSVFGDSSHAL
jgi:hypothetical protein